MAYSCRPRLCSQGGSGLNSATVCLKPGPAQFSLRAPSQIGSHEFLPHQAWCPCSGRRQSVHWPGWHKGFFQALYLGPTVSEKIAWSCSGLHPQLFQRRPPRVAGQDQKWGLSQEGCDFSGDSKSGSAFKPEMHRHPAAGARSTADLCKGRMGLGVHRAGVWPGHPSVCPRIGYCPL